MTAVRQQGQRLEKDGRTANATSWPPTEPGLLADRLFDDLAADLAVDHRITKAVNAWIDRAERRIADAVRPHLGDVNVACCGSLASRTHLSTGWDVDLAVQTFPPLISYRPADSDPVSDLARWLTTDLEVPVTVDAHGVTLDALGGVAVRVLPFWHFEDRASDRMRLARCPVDPVAHAQLVTARDSHLGNAGCFSRLIRVVKHLTRRGNDSDEGIALPSFVVETLALNVCTTPFCLAEGVTNFLRTCAELVRKPFAHPLAPGAPVNLVDGQLLTERLSEAADVCEGALFATEPSGLDRLASLLRRPTDQHARRPTAQTVAKPRLTR